MSEDSLKTAEVEETEASSSPAESAEAAKEVSAEPPAPGSEKEAPAAPSGEPETAKPAAETETAVATETVIATETTEATETAVDTETAKPAAETETAAPKRPYRLPKWVDEQDLNQQELEEYEQMFQMYDETLKDIVEGEIVPGQVIAIENGEVIIDVGFKSEGAISLSEFTDPDELEIGQDIEVFLEDMEAQEGQLVLSKQKADFMKVWDKIKDAHEEGAVVEGQILRRIKGGLVVDLFGVDAFLPGSQVALKQTPNLDQFIGEKLPFKIIKLNKSRRNIVVSRRVVLEVEKEKQKQAIIAELDRGQVRKGVVKNITDFGAFVDLGGIDGLLHITDISWGRIGHPSELVTIGSEITVAILEFDRERERISLGLKQLEPYPWANVEEKYPVGSRITGRVVSITDYGAFVELERGVEGLIHISEMSWTKHVTHPSKMVTVNENVDAMVLKVDQQNEKISLGMKQTQPDPWLSLNERYNVGAMVRGRVRNITAFGAFVEIEEGIDGLVHISDMSWTRRIKHPSEVVRKGEEVDVMVLNIDPEARRVSLGIKQVSEDPWISLAEVYPVNTETTGVIIRLLERGVVVELSHEVEGFVPISQLNHPEIKRPGDAFKEGEEIPLKVIEFDGKNRRVVLSVKAYFRDRERAEIDDYLNRHPVAGTVIGDVVDVEKEAARSGDSAKAEDTVKAKEAAKAEDAV